MALLSKEIQKGWAIGVDIGGTFTDVAAFNPKNGELNFGKTLSTYQYSIFQTEIEPIMANISRRGRKFKMLA